MQFAIVTNRHTDHWREVAGTAIHSIDRAAARRGARQVLSFL